MPVVLPPIISLLPVLLPASDCRRPPALDAPALNGHSATVVSLRAPFRTNIQRGWWFQRLSCPRVTHFPFYICVSVSVDNTVERLLRLVLLQPLLLPMQLLRQYTMYLPSRWFHDALRQPYFTI